MFISNSSNNSERLQAELSEYGLLRQDAKEGLRQDGVDKEVFGIKRSSEKPELIFTDAVENIVEDQAQLAIIAPEFDSFDMLVTRDFKKAISSVTDIKTIKDFVARIVDKV